MSQTLWVVLGNMIYVVTSIDISTLFNNIRNTTNFKNNVLLVTTVKIVLISCIHFNDLFIIDFKKPVTIFGSPESFSVKASRAVSMQQLSQCPFPPVRLTGLVEQLKSAKEQKQNLGPFPCLTFSPFAFLFWLKLDESWRTRFSHSGLIKKRHEFWAGAIWGGMCGSWSGNCIHIWNSKEYR